MIKISKKGTKHNVKRQYWTSDEVELLKEIYPIKSFDELEKVFNRNQSQIRCKANKLGLHKEFVWTSKLILSAIDNFILKNGRAPKSKEFGRKNNLPSWKRVSAVFNVRTLKEFYDSHGVEYPTSSKSGTIDWEWEIKSTTIRVKKYCDYCKEEYSIPLSKYRSGSRFCSKECRNEWQKTDENKGFNNPRFTSEYIKCDYCGNEFVEKQYKIKGQENHFCSKACRQNWFSEIYTQTEDWRDKRRKIAVKSLEEENVKKVDTAPQKIICEFLDKNKIKYKKEKGFVYYSIDIYLLDYNIPIEIMGTYWHCDHRKYSVINYDAQVNRIRIDKAKHTYIKNEYGLEILYLWEDDIYNNLDRCIDMIKTYIKDNFLKNYHSFNFMKKNVELPYMDRSAEFVSSITDIKLKEKRSMKQNDKWITFNCEYCGKEKEELISHYNKKKHHFCSQECRGKYDHDKNTTEVVCTNCGKLFRKKNCDIKKSKTKTFCCCRECRKEYDNQGGLNTFCYTCGKPIYVLPSKVNKTKTHHCSLSCASKYGQIVKANKNLKEK